MRGLNSILRFNAERARIERERLARLEADTCHIEELEAAEAALRRLGSSLQAPPTAVCELCGDEVLEADMLHLRGGCRFCTQEETDG